MPDRVYVVHFHEAGMHVRPDPSGYETREIAPGPEAGARWSEGALRKRGEAAQ